MFGRFSEMVFGPTTCVVLPVGPDGELRGEDVQQAIADGLERSIALHEASIAEGTENPPPTLSKLDASKDCRIGAADFAAIIAFEASHASMYASAVSVVREVPASSVPEGTPVQAPPPIAQGSGDKWYEPAVIFVSLSVSQLFARWFAMQKGLTAQMPWPPKELRFNVGDRVECQIVPGCFAFGVVVRAGRCAYIEFNASQPSPYRVKLDNSEVTELVQQRLLPAGHNGYIHAPVDVDSCIRASRSIA